jgi:cell division septal protein FtsQ
MKLFKSQRKTRNDLPVINRTSLKGVYPTGSFPNQTKESQVLLKKIKNRKRRVINSRVVLRKKHGVVWKVILLILVMGVAAFLFFNYDVPGYFKISKANIVGAGVFVNNEDIKNLIERNTFEKYIFSVNEIELSEVLTKSFLGAKSIAVKKDYPNSISVYVEERVPLAVVYNSDEEYFLIDSEGFVLGLITNSFLDLPKINYEGQIITGTFLEKDIIPISIEILKFAEQENLKISSMSFNPNYAKLYLDTGAEVFIGYDKENQKSLRTIKALIDNSDNEKNMIKKIDLRYDKVIVLYD